MRACASCQRLFPEVVGAPTQVCPHCGHEAEAEPPSGATRPRAPADPVGAIQEAWRVGRARYGSFLLLWLPSFALDVGTAFAIARYEAAAGLPADPTLWTTGQQMQFLGVVLPLYLLLYSVRLGLWTFVAARVLDATLGGRRLAAWRSLAAPALAAGFVLTLTYAAGMLLLFVGFLVFLHWFLYVPAFVAQGRGLGAAFDASRRFARERRTVGFTALVVLVWVVAAVPSFATLGLPGWQGIVAPAALAWLVGPLVPLLAASYVALAASAPAHVAAAAPAATPRGGTTKCPGCGALIPYEATGSPVDVACPSCGRAGRVL